MEVNRTIGPYNLCQRTPYSKFRLLDIDTNEDVTDKNSELFEEILCEYQEQMCHPDSYFDIDGNRLISVKDYVLDNSIKYLFIPSYINIIEQNALQYGDYRYISLPDNVKKIGKYAFKDCDCLEYVNLPDTIKTIGAGAFKDCNSLKKLILPEIDKIDEYLFSGCSGLKYIHIPGSVSGIGKYAFYDCDKLKKINLPYGVKILGHGAFAGCSNLKKINLPNSLESIGERCFILCRSLQKIDIPDSVKSISKKAFENCITLESVKLPNGITMLNDYTFISCYSLKDIEIPDSVSILNGGIFSNVKNLENINIPKGLCSVYGYPFLSSDIKSLTFNYDLPDLYITGADSIDCKLLGGCNIEKIIIDGNVSIITPDAFRSFGRQIREIEYHGTKEQFEKFKENNKETFRFLKNAKKINFIDDKIISEKEQER